MSQKIVRICDICGRTSEEMLVYHITFIGKKGQEPHVKDICQKCAYVTEVEKLYLTPFCDESCFSAVKEAVIEGKYPN